MLQVTEFRYRHIIFGTILSKTCTTSKVQIYTACFFSDLSSVANSMNQIFHYPEYIWSLPLD